MTKTQKKRGQGAVEPGGLGTPSAAAKQGKPPLCMGSKRHKQMPLSMYLRTPADVSLGTTVNNIGCAREETASGNVHIAFGIDMDACMAAGNPCAEDEGVGRQCLAEHCPTSPEQA